MLGEIFVGGDECTRTHGDDFTLGFFLFFFTSGTLSDCGAELRRERAGADRNIL